MTKTRKLGDAEVFPIGLGGMPMSLSSRPPEEQSIRTIHAALDAGVNFIDTADAYSADATDFGHNERLIAKALKGRRDGVIIATKGGHTRTEDGGWELDGRPEYIKRACEQSLRALETDRIDLYQYHRPDPDVPYAETIGAFKELQDEGKVRWVGISNANTEQIELARGIVDIVSVQNQLSLEYGSPIGKGEVELCEQHGIAFLPWSPFGGISKAGDAPGTHDPVRQAAEAHGVSPQQVVLAWLLALSPVMIPIPGASRPESITDSVEAVELELSHEELQAIGGIAQTA
jgi:aryl-alcohol dehydrogenase-like predicted oxidoreductase